MTTIRDTHLAFRDKWLPASFRGAMFHVEAGSKESGRRIVTHEFPKRELPYSEDMGRKAFQFSVRGYILTYPIDTSIDLYKKDYTIARDALILQLETEGTGVLQLPTLDPFTVVCSGYRWTEEERAGGYCVFDMTFAEWGQAPIAAANTYNDLKAASLDLQARVLTVMDGIEAALRATAAMPPATVIAPGLPPPSR
jgi:prophage DNA circulation protein